MNIFYLSHDQTECAKWYVDKHVSKMILESVQIVCNVHHIHGIENPALYRPFNPNHPVCQWAAKSLDNYEWIYNLAETLGIEFTLRFGGQHKSIGVLNQLSWEPVFLDQFLGFTAPALCMPDKYKLSDPIDAYRNYYTHGKAHIHKWTKRNPPIWIAEHKEFV